MTRPPTTRAMALGFLVLQVVWLLALPPFRGSDEFDHAYRAAAVARGQWVPDPESATRGTGAFVDVPRDLVEAAAPECNRLPYTTAVDCEGTPAAGGLVRVASGAGRYHFLFYEAIGLPALPFHGATSLYVMRLAGALLCWLMFLAVLAATRTWATSGWPFIGIAVASTPILMFSTVVAAPNGLEMVAAMALWSSLVGVFSERAAAARGRLLPIVAVSGAVLATLRPLGPVWCGLVLLTVLAALKVDLRQFRTVVGSRAGAAAFAFVTLATLASVAWIESMGSLTIGRVTGSVLSVSERISYTSSQLPLWVFQSIAAFPLRNVASTPVVYGAMLTLGLGLLVPALLWAPARFKVVLLGSVVVSFAVPALITFRTINDFGLAWQGRYSMPYSIGVMVLAALALDRSARTARASLLVVAGALFVVGQVTGPLEMFLRERRESPGVANGDWVYLPPAVLLALGVVGAGLLWAGAATARSTAPKPVEDRVPA